MILFYYYKIKMEEKPKDLTSINSELLTEEEKQAKRKSERLGYQYGIICQFLWAVVSIQIKTMVTLFPDAYSLNTIAFWRIFPLLVYGYYSCKKKGIHIHTWGEIEHKFWFVVRSLGFYFMIVLWVLMNIYFRVSTCQCIANTNPVIVLIISSFVLKEKFYPRYIVGVIICIIGAFMIVSNERGESANSDNTNTNSNVKQDNIILGLVFSLSHLALNSFANFGQRLISKEGIEGDEQNFFLGVYNTVPAVIVMIFQRYTGLSNIKYVLYVLTNGPVFYLANYYNAEALKYISINKFIPLVYLSILFVFILGFIFLGENVYFTDIIGSLLILGFQVYNIYVPTTK